ncbi:MAG: rod shape-determining protein RodA [Parvibaculales bacterium]
MSLSYLSMRASWRDKLVSLNWLLVVLVAGLCLIGVMALYSVAEGQFAPWANRQLYRVIFGFIVMLGVAFIDVRHWLTFAYLLFILGLVSLLGVEFYGSVQMGARRWLDLGVIYVQPSEPMRIALILALARYYHNLPPERVSHPLWTLMPILMILVPGLLIMRQPDLGTAVLFAVTGVTLMFLVGLNWRYFFLGAVSMIPVAIIIWNKMLEYQKLRVMTFLNPERDPLGAGYHILQSKIAIGSGGVWGKGFMNGSQSQLDFLPEKHTDFIFTMIAEEMGLMGSLSILLLYAGVLALGLLISYEAKSKFCRLVAATLSFSLFVYLFVNVAMVIGLLPVVGVPLPFISYGGTSIVTLLISVGLLLNIHLHKNVELPQA